MCMNDVEVHQGRTVLNKLGEAEGREELREAHDRYLVDADALGYICPFVGVEMNVVFVESGKPIGQLGRVLFPAADETIFRDDYGNFDPFIMFHNCKITAKFVPNATVKTDDTNLLKQTIRTCLFGHFGCIAIALLEISASAAGRIRAGAIP